MRTLEGTNDRTNHDVGTADWHPAGADVTTSSNPLYHPVPGARRPAPPAALSALRSYRARQKARQAWCRDWSTSAFRPPGSVTVSPAAPQRAGVLRPAGSGRSAGPQAVQHLQSRRGHWVRPREGGPVWFGGGKLAADLTLPKLCCCWDPARIRAAERFTAVERNALWEHAARTAGVERRPGASVAPGCGGLSCMKSGLAASRSLPVRLRRAVPPQRPSRRERAAPNAPAVALACPAASERCARGPGQAPALLPAMVAAWFNPDQAKSSEEGLRWRDKVVAWRWWSETIHRWVKARSYTGPVFRSRRRGCLGRRPAG